MHVSSVYSLRQGVARLVPANISSTKHVPFFRATCGRPLGLQSLPSLLSARTILTASPARSRATRSPVSTKAVISRVSNLHRPRAECVPPAARPVLARNASATLSPEAGHSPPIFRQHLQIGPLTATIAAHIKQRASDEIGRSYLAVMKAVAGARAGAARSSSTSSWRSKAVFMLGNIAYAISLVEYGTTSMLTIRLAAMTGCSLSVFYFMMQPSIPWVAVGWNLIFSTILIGQCYSLLCKAEDVELTAREEALFSQCFAPYEFGRNHFKTLADAGEWREYKEGECLTHSDDEHGQLMLIQDGIVELESREGHGPIAQLSSGSFVGEIAFVTDSPEKFTAKAKTTVRVFQWSHERLDQLLELDPEFEARFTTRITHSVIGKMQNMASRKESVLEQQHEMLSVVLSNKKITDAHRQQVEAWNTQHGITAKEHSRGLKKCGWTEEDYARGHKVVAF